MGPYSAVDLSANPRPKIGASEGGHPVYEAYQPADLPIANRISWITAEEGAYNHHIPVPHGMSLGINHAHPQLHLALGDFLTLTPAKFPS